MYHPMYNIPETFGKALSYEGQIHALCEAMQSLSANVEDLYAKYDEQIIDTWSYSYIWEGKNAVFFGDSFLAPNIDNSEHEFVANEITTILGMNKFNFAIPGAGFARPTNLISSQQTTCDNTMTQDEKDETALVVCMAGCNDLLNMSSQGITQAAIVTGIHNFILWANSRFHNARIVVVPFNWGFGNLTFSINYLITNVMNSINTSMHGKGCILIPYAWTWNLGIAQRFQNAVHPNYTGYRVIINHILNACMGNEVNNFSTGNAIIMSNEAINNTSNRCVYNVANGIVYINGFIRPTESHTGTTQEYQLTDSLPAICTPNNSIWALPLISTTTGNEIGYVTFKSTGIMACRFTTCEANEVGCFNGAFNAEVGVEWSA